LFASGDFSLKELAAKARDEGLTLRGTRIHRSTLHQILRKRLYSGDFEFNGETYQGTYEPLVSKETWERVQTLLDSHGSTNRHRIKHDFAFSGLVRCGHCGCMFVAEIKKGRYVYYHCTGQRGKCEEPSTREESLVDRFASCLRELSIPSEVIAWLRSTYVESDVTERAARERTIKQHRAEFERLESRIETLYNDRLDGRIAASFYDAKAREIRAQQQVLMRKIEQIQANAPRPVNDAIDFMELTGRAATLFRQRNAHEQRRLLRTSVRNAAWKGGELQMEFEEPFETLRGSNRASHSNEIRHAGQERQMKNWLLKLGFEQIILELTGSRLAANRPMDCNWAVGRCHRS
jgi:site-specific DNA recombinase